MITFKSITRKSTKTRLHELVEVIDGFGYLYTHTFVLKTRVDLENGVYLIKTSEVESYDLETKGKVKFEAIDERFGNGNSTEINFDFDFLFDSVKRMKSFANADKCILLQHKDSLSLAYRDDSGSKAEIVLNKESVSRFFFTFISIKDYYDILNSNKQDAKRVALKIYHDALLSKITCYDSEDEIFSEFYLTGKKEERIYF